MELFRSDDVWWENVDDVAERAKENAAFEEKVVEPGTQGREIARVVGTKFKGADRADLACVADLMEIAELREADGVDLGDSGYAVEDRLIIENL